MIILYSIYDFIFFPFYVVVLLFLFYRYNKVNSWSSSVSKHLYRAFAVRAFASILYFLMLQFNYGGIGDSTGYWQSIASIRDMNWATKSDFLFSPSAVVTYQSSLSYYFSEYNALVMGNASNAAVAKIGYWPAILCNNSYLTLCLFFSSFAFIGCWQLFLLFIRYYPKLQKEFALSLLYLPSVCFWSSGVLKDSLTFGASCLFVVSIHKLLIDRRNIFASIFQLFLYGLIVLVIKPYIILALIPGLSIWIFGKFNFTKLNKQMRGVITFTFIIVACGVIGFLLNYLTSTEYAKQLAAESITHKITEARDIYEINETTAGNSYFTLGTSDPVLGFFFGIVATLFRPFLWETKNFSMFFSGAEAFVFSLITLHIFFKLGFIKVVRHVFSNSETIFFFLFTMMFAGAVGSSTGNFGTLVRYKIPCLPFYLMMLFIIMENSKLPYPDWLNKLLGKKRVKSRVNLRSSIRQT